MDVRPRIFLSGPMSARPGFNRDAFNAAAVSLTRQGFDVWNPADITDEQARRAANRHLRFREAPEWGDYLAVNLAALPYYPTVATLPGWQDSKGSRIEVTAARGMGHHVTNYVPPEPSPTPAARTGAVCRRCGEWAGDCK